MLRFYYTVYAEIGASIRKINGRGAVNIGFITLNLFDDVHIRVYSDGRIKTGDHNRVRTNGRMDNRKGKFLRPGIDSYGYERVVLTRSGVRKTFQIHRLIAMAFIPNLYDKPTVNHIDGDKRNNNVTNLEWATHSERKRHAISIGLCSKNIKSLQIANERRAIPIVFEGDAYSSCRAASRITGYSRTYINKRAEAVNE